MTFTDDREKTLWAQAWMNFSGDPVDRAAACDNLILELRQRESSAPPEPVTQSLYVRLTPDFDDSHRMLLIDSFRSAFNYNPREARRCFKGAAAAGVTLSATQEQINNFNSKVFEHNLHGLTVSVK